MLNRKKSYAAILLLIFGLLGCDERRTISDADPMTNAKTAAQILNNPDYLAIAYGGYRDTTREVQPTLPELKEDLKILSAMGVKIIRTYNTHYAQAGNLLKAISELQKEHPNFEMYVMLGAWIDCENAWTDLPPNHNAENEIANTEEINRAVELAQRYPEIVKIIAVGNEAMVKWAERYYVPAGVILKWVNYLQSLKEEAKLDKNLWITSSDNFASWGGADTSYHTEDLANLIRAVDYVSLHTYPMHDTHYHPIFWGVLESELHLPKEKAIKQVMKRAFIYAKKQYHTTAKYVHSIDSSKPIHIGETGWASASTDHYGLDGSKACDEFKEGIYYKLMRKWTKKERIACFYFEAFDEKWKDVHHPEGSENHFGLFKINGEAKYALWKLVDEGKFDGLKRNGHPIIKTYGGNLDSLLQDVAYPPIKQLK